MCVWWLGLVIGECVYGGCGKVICEGMYGGWGKLLVKVCIVVGAGYW